MDRRRTGQKRPAPSEGNMTLSGQRVLLRLHVYFAEIQCWQNICTSLDHLRGLSMNPATSEAISRVNRIISSFSPDDQVYENPESLKHSHKKLFNSITEIRDSTEKETKLVPY